MCLSPTFFQSVAECERKCRSAILSVEKYNTTLSRAFHDGVNRRKPETAVPDVSTIQKMIEMGWEAGFDPVGVSEYRVIWE